MTGADAGATTHPGVQVLLDPNGISAASWRPVYESFAIHGGLGTTEEGAVSDQGQRVWIRAIAAGPVVRATDGRGQVLTGRWPGTSRWPPSAGPRATSAPAPRPITR